MKWVVLVSMIVVSPLLYSIFMGYWTIVWIGIIGFIDPSSYIVVSALMVLGNTLCIVAVGVPLSIPVIKFFGERGYIAAIAVASSIVSWSIYGLVIYGQKTPSFITVIEWLTVILIVPFLGNVLYKHFNNQRQISNA